LDNFIKCENLSYKYITDEELVADVLSGINLDISKGEFVALLGHNGSGKSTLAKHLNALVLPCGGKVFVGGMDTLDESMLIEIRRLVGLVLQNPDNQIVATIVEEDVAFAPENLGLDSAEIRQRVDSALKAVGMYEYKDAAPFKLSGGQKQRIAIAGILAMQPTCIVLDEPTAMLDPKGRREVIETLQQLNSEKGTTIVLITHYMEEAVLAKTVYCMDKGKIVLSGSPKEVFSQVEKLKSIKLDVPQATDLCYLLNKQGAGLPDDILTADEFIEALEKKGIRGIK